MSARVLILGAYNPVPTHPLAGAINQYLTIWDSMVASHFSEDPLIAIVKISDIVRPDRLSRSDHFHPGGAAYADASKRIATMLTS